MVQEMSMYHFASAMAENNSTQDEELQDMSDPLAVFTQGGISITNRGINLKIGKTYDTGNPNTAAMNILEIKGIYSDTLGWEDLECELHTLAIAMQTFIIYTG